jgi:hypothetical protein
MYLEVGREKAPKLQSSKAPKLQSSKAPKLQSSKAQTASSSIAVFVVFFLIVAMMFVSLGCGGPVATASVEKATVSAASVDAESSGLSSIAKITRIADGRFAIDAGVVFADQESYLCFPLKQLGIEEYLSTSRVESSCDCVEATVVHYLDPAGSRCPALLLRFRQESVTQEGESDELNGGQEVHGKLESGLDSLAVTPVNLGVDVTIDLESGRRVHSTVNFLHTVIQE